MAMTGGEGSDGGTEKKILTQLISTCINFGIIWNKCEL